MQRQMTNGGGRRPTKLYDDSDDERLELKIDSIGGRNKEKTTGFVYVLTFFSALGGFLFGYDTGVIAGALILLRNEFELSLVWEELIVSVTVAAAALFALVGGYFNDRLGRRPVILAASVIFTVGALCMGIAGDRYLLLAGRIIVGAGIGKRNK
ncbi:hypothetical protein FSP39_019199 [Pinctada imbricata]|uniref:Major facilitator superfamily (MFS) profile domain-containing protein n=1 Tax=Pinctada imbricata TaxID=66713 RepID=A0AA88YE92_PINIB|nr:hypothetical protein FSP39_019199 [Pinctada imbricata]